MRTLLGILGRAPVRSSLRPGLCFDLFNPLWQTSPPVLPCHTLGWPIQSSNLYCNANFLRGGPQTTRLVFAMVAVCYFCSLVHGRLPNAWRPRSLLPGPPLKYKYFLNKLLKKIINVAAWVLPPRSPLPDFL